MKDTPLTIAERNGARLRHAREADLSRLDEITVECYTPIQASFEKIVGKAFCSAICKERWQDRKTAQVRNLFADKPENVWVLEGPDGIFGYITFEEHDGTSMGVIDNNGVMPSYRGKGWGTFMYRHVLAHFRNKGLAFAMVETDLDEPHEPARRAYEAVGFNREHRVVRYVQELDALADSAE